MTAGSAGFAARVIDWQRQHGRHDLPWQGTRDPYRVWLSEIMLQQTQVATVQGYYPRFLARFPDVAALAEAPEQDVMALWSGLGYYSRARNLHRCAREVVARHGGRFPASAAQLQELPGIGRSTAAAIAAFCFGERAAILDGNVKRVLTRHFGIADDVTLPATTQRLWALAESLLPHDGLAESMPRYTQGLMDLGATLCTTRRPRCADCPLRASCVAAREAAPERYPVRAPRPAREQRALWLLHAVDEAGALWLEPRPAPGIWAGLHCLPGFDARQALIEALPPSAADNAIDHAPIRHLLTHRELHLHVLSVRLSRRLRLSVLGGWHEAPAWAALGLPAPVRRFLLARSVDGVPNRFK